MVVAQFALTGTEWHRQMLLAQNGPIGAAVPTLTTVCLYTCLCLYTYNPHADLIGYFSKCSVLMSYLTLSCSPGDSIDGAFLKDLVFSVIKKCEDAGCYVDAVISDMGPSNKALWKKCGISAKRSATPVVSCNHPCAADTNRQLYFLADAPHVLKNIRGHLVRGQSIFLPDDIVAKYGLPTNEVSRRVKFIHFKQVLYTHVCKVIFSALYLLNPLQ